MKDKLDWRIYYGDGSTFDNLQGEPKDAPAFDVQVITQKNRPNGRRSISLYDYYYYRDGRWWGGDLGGIIVYLQDLGILSYDKDTFMPVVNGIPMDGFRIITYAIHTGFVKLGKFIEKKDFYKIIAKAEADNDFPIRMGRYRGEITGEGER